MYRNMLAGALLLLLVLAIGGLAVAYIVVKTAKCIRYVYPARGAITSCRT